MVFSSTGNSHFDSARRCGYRILPGSGPIWHARCIIFAVSRAMHVRANNVGKAIERLKALASGCVVNMRMQDSELKAYQCNHRDYYFLVDMHSLHFQ